MNTRLPDGSRVAVVGAPSSINGPTLNIRKFNRWYTSDELIDSGSMPAHIRDTVVELIGKKKNGIISGGTGSGKTTLMKAFRDHIPENKRLLIIEQPAELKVAHQNAVRWEFEVLDRVLRESLPSKISKEAYRRLLYRDDIFRGFNFPIPDELVCRFPVREVKRLPHLLTTQDALYPDRAETLRPSRVAFTGQAVSAVQRKHDNSSSTCGVSDFLEASKVLIIKRDKLVEAAGVEPASEIVVSRETPCVVYSEISLPQLRTDKKPRKLVR